MKPRGQSTPSNVCFMNNIKTVGVCFILDIYDLLFTPNPHNLQYTTLVYKSTALAAQPDNNVAGRESSTHGGR